MLLPGFSLLGSTLLAGDTFTGELFLQGVFTPTHSLTHGTIRRRISKEKPVNFHGIRTAELPQLHKVKLSAPRVSISLRRRTVALLRPDIA